jgi:hypothetical protein
MACRRLSSRFWSGSLSSILKSWKEPKKDYHLTDLVPTPVAGQPHTAAATAEAGSGGEARSSSCGFDPARSSLPKPKQMEVAPAPEVKIAD